MRRRFFLKMAAGASATLLLPACGSNTRASPPKRILVLGGTNFLGPAIVESALARSHEVTLFNRGITRPDLFPQLEKLRGVREVDGGDLAQLSGRRRWDAVIDVWPEQAALVEQTAHLLADRTDYYFFCSSIAVYKDFSHAGIGESAATHQGDPGWYGGEKALAEQLVTGMFPGRHGIARCHAILGPRDDGTAYHYWLRKLAGGGQVLAPGDGSDPVQFVDVRDVAAWIIDSIEHARTGIYNLVGDSPPLTFSEFLEASRQAIGSSARLVWADADFLRGEQGLRSFTDLPLWAPLDEDAGFYQIDGRRATRAGLQYRPLQETARDAWRWYRSHFFRHTAFPLGGQGISADREQEILAAWARAEAGL